MKGFLDALMLNKTLVYAALVIVAAGVGIAWMYQSGNGGEETFVVRAGGFLQQVSISGKVVAAQHVDLGFTQSGRISRVYVEVGQTVSANAILAEIENADVRAMLLQRQAMLEAEEARLRALEEGTREEELAVAEASVASAEVVLAQANQGVVDAIESAYAVADNAIRNKLDLLLTNPRSAYPKVSFLTSNSQTVITVETERVSVEAVLQRWQEEMLSLTPSSDLPRAIARTQEDLADISALLIAAAAALNGAIPNNSVSQSDINEYVSDVAAARSAVNSAISSLTTASTARANAVASQTTAGKNLALKRAGALQSGIDSQKAQIKAAEAGVADARATLQKTFLMTPFAGIITRVDAKAGKIVSPNTAEISMIGTGAYHIESFVPEVNLSLLKAGDEAMVTLDAYGSGVTFLARVVSIDPAETVRDGVSTYRTIIQFMEQDPRIRTGMTANVRITTEKRDNVLAVPQGVVVERDGRKYVRVREGEQTIEREITTGSVSSLGSVEVLSGLSEGDVIILSPTN